VALNEHSIAERRSENASVTTLELFFDLVFVLAITQCTSLMSSHGTWTSIGQSAVMLGLLWWSWCGYAWLTSAVDPELLSVRLPVFASMTGLMIASMAIPHAFDNQGLLFAGAYGIVRAAHIVLFIFASRGDPGFRKATISLGVSSAIGVALLLAGLAFEDTTRLLIWSVALALDLAGPFIASAEGWALSPSHFAERHGLILIIALGESIVAIGLGAESELGVGVITAAALGMIGAFALWWVYFDVLAHVAERRLREAQGSAQNEMARDAYSYLHFPMVFGIALFAMGLKKTLAHVDLELATVSGFALFGGTALFLLGLLSFGLRTTTRMAWDTLIGAGVLIALIPLAMHVDALVALGVFTIVIVVLVGYKVVHYGEGRQRVRGRVLETPPDQYS
jgi:low temperature requirement protein LtrA